MDHAYIEQHGLIESYLRGQVPPDEEARFEAHFAGCAQCQEQLTLERGLRRGIRAVAAEEGARRAAAVQLGIVAWLARRSRRAQAGVLLAGLLLATGLPTAFFLTRSAPRGGLGAPRGDTPVVLLSRFRSDPGEPAATIDLSRIGDFLVLAVEVDDDPRLASYRVAVSSDDGRRLYQESDLLPNAFAALMLTFPASFFTPGDYRLTVEGLDQAGDAADLAGYPFRVVAGP